MWVWTFLAVYEEVEAMIREMASAEAKPPSRWLAKQTWPTYNENESVFSQLSKIWIIQSPTEALAALPGDTYGMKV
jgi:hypothetical protein